MQTPVFMGWTIVPVELVVRAWTDAKFRREFLLWPTQTLDENGVFIPVNVNFCVIENTTETYHLVLPFRKPFTFGWSKQRIIETLREETGGDNSLEYWLPVEVMVEAYFNPEFRRRLFINASEVLEEMGYETHGRNFMVLENTEATLHLVLPVNKWEKHGLSPEELEALLVSEFTAETLLN